jgi:hypothetical protein
MGYETKDDQHGEGEKQLPPQVREAKGIYHGLKQLGLLTGLCLSHFPRYPLNLLRFSTRGFYLLLCGLTEFISSYHEGTLKLTIAEDLDRFLKRRYQPGIKKSLRRNLDAFLENSQPMQIH